MRSLLESRLESIKRFCPEGHPECREGEVWVCNVDASDVYGWQTARLGETAYAEGGAPWAALKPLFVSKVEVLEAPEGVGMLGMSCIQRSARVPWHEASRWQLVLQSVAKQQES